MSKEQVIMNGPKSVEESNERSIKKLVRSRGFDENGRYKFEENTSNPIKDRNPGNINNGFVTGYFDTNIDEDIILRKNDFLAASWRRICSCMGYPYNDANEIDAFIISENKIRVQIDIKTPDEYTIENSRSIFGETSITSTGTVFFDNTTVTAENNASEKDKGIKEYLNS